jgi:hypothetical protein
LAQAPDTTKIEHSKDTAMLLAAIMVFLFMVFLLSMNLGFKVWGSGFKVNMAAKRRKKHKNQFSGLVNSRCYNEQKSKFRLFTNPSRFKVQASPGLRLVAYASESATGCGYEIVCIFYGRCFPSPHLAMPGLGQGFKGYN